MATQQNFLVFLMTFKSDMCIKMGYFLEGNFEYFQIYFLILPLKITSALANLKFSGCKIRIQSIFFEIEQKANI